MIACVVWRFYRRCCAAIAPLLRHCRHTSAQSSLIFQMAAVRQKISDDCRRLPPPYDPWLLYLNRVRSIISLG